KWRPRNFSEMVGQEHVLKALTNALDADRLHHAFLFAGTRGVGKTTVARILAKCLNCETGVTSSPCGECAACVEIDEGRFVDLIEVDAASRTKVDDTRELLDNVQYTPTRGRYKVYLIDEVHMLSRHSFNALLKTLEEPPPHVKFLLATTDPQRLPVTVLSRCLQFNLKRLTLDLIAGQLKTICTAEPFEHDAEALTLLARAADGSMRDSLSLLDQAVAFGGGKVTQDNVLTMLGTIDRRQVFKLLDALAAGDAPGAMSIVADMDQYAPDYAGVLADMATLLQRAALARAVPDTVGADTLDGEAIRALASAMGPEDLQLGYQIAITGRRDLGLAPDPRAGFEMILLRMLAFRPAGAADRAAPDAPAAAKAAINDALSRGFDLRQGPLFTASCCSSGTTTMSC
ncbi:MAG: DNA polymerase III subunit gamma/tau, partial [Pseudomonadota bacterium]